jgi:hypothetical protein
VKKNFPTSAWERSTSSTKKTRRDLGPACRKLEAAAVVAAAVVAAAEVAAAEAAAVSEAAVVAEAAAAAVDGAAGVAAMAAAVAVCRGALAASAKASCEKPANGFHGKRCEVKNLEHDAIAYFGASCSRRSICNEIDTPVVMVGFGWSRPDRVWCGGVGMIAWQAFPR